MSDFTLDELREIRGFVTNAPTLEAKLDRLITERAPGAQVFQLTLPTGSGERRRRGKVTEQQAWAPTLNEYNGLVGWQKANLRKAIGLAIQAATRAWPGWHARFREHAEPRTVKGKTKVCKVREGGRRRLVRVTRYSPRATDEVTVDVLGGKMVVDCLVRFGVLVGDDEACIVRDAAWYPAHQGEGIVKVDVFELPGLPEVIRKRQHSKAS